MVAFLDFCPKSIPQLCSRSNKSEKIVILTLKVDKIIVLRFVSNTFYTKMFKAANMYEFGRF